MARNSIDLYHYSILLFKHIKIDNRTARLSFKFTGFPTFPDRQNVSFLQYLKVNAPNIMLTLTKNIEIIHTLSSHSKGKCSTISKGSASAANTINSDIPLFKVLVAKKDDNFGCNEQTVFHWGRVTPI